VKDLDTGGYGDRHGAENKEGVGVRGHAHCKHVMGPNAHADKSDGHGCRDHDRVTEDRLAGEYGDNLRDKSERGKDQDVDLRVTEDPEEMHPHHRRTTRLSIEEMSPEIAIDHQHDLGRG